LSPKCSRLFSAVPHENKSVLEGELKPSCTYASVGLAVDKLVAALLMAALLSLSVAEYSHTVQAQEAGAPLQPDQTQAWVLIVLAAVLIGAYIAVMVFLIAKKNKP
jgi:hypothetical protein